MSQKAHLKPVFIVGACMAAAASAAAAFQGRIEAIATQGGETTALLYTAGTNALRIEVTATNWPNPIDILDLPSGTLTLLFPHNRTFVRLKPAVDSPSVAPPGMAAMPPSMPPMPPIPAAPAGLPQGVGPRPQGAPGAPGMPAMPDMPAPPSGLPAGVGPQPRELSSAPAMPAPPVTGALPAMPMMPTPAESLELQATGQKTNLLGLACARYELKQGGETLEVWATDQLLPYQPYLRNQAPRFGPRGLEERWPARLEERKLFPLLVTLRFGDGAGRFRFEVKSIVPEKLTEADAKLFQPPSGYVEIRPLPF